MKRMNMKFNKKQSQEEWNLKNKFKSDVKKISRNYKNKNKI